MTNHYARGTAFERKVREALREDGYEVMRSAGSKTKIDLVAMKTGQLVFLQCKLNGLCAPAERSRLRDLAGMVGALPVVAYSHKEGHAAAVVRYRLLTGDGPKHFASWTPDTVAESSMRTEALARLAVGLHVPAELLLSERLDIESPVKVRSGDPTACLYEAR